VRQATQTRRLKEKGMVSLRAQRADDVGLLVDLATRSWKDVEASIDAALGSPLDRLATPS
jgi:hypothetical protein